MSSCCYIECYGREHAAEVDNQNGTLHQPFVFMYKVYNGLNIFCVLCYCEIFTICAPKCVAP